MDLNNWLSLIISLILSFVGIFMAHKSDVTLARMEELSRANNRMMEEFTSRLMSAQTEMLRVALGVERADGSVEDVAEQIERLRSQVLSETSATRINQ